MNDNYKPYIPQGISEIIDQLGFMMLSSPTFIDKLGYFREQNIDTVFFQLNQGLRLIQKKLGDDKYQALVAMSDKMRAHFEADHENEGGIEITENLRAGSQIINEMQALLRKRK